MYQIGEKLEEWCRNGRSDRRLFELLEQPIRLGRNDCAVDFGGVKSLTRGTKYGGSQGSVAQTQFLRFTFMVGAFYKK